MSNKIQEIYRRLVLWLAVLFVPLIAIACAGPPAQPEVATEPTAAPIEAAAPTEAATPVEAEFSPTAEEIASERSADDTLRLFYWQAPTIVNPHLSTGTKDLAASRIVYEPLASFDKNGQMVPFLAAEIPSLENSGVAADGRSVTWKLKQGVKWSDGEPFTAADVLFTYEYVTNPDVKAISVATYAAVESVEVIDDYTVKINFKDVTPAWSLLFVGTSGLIIPRHIFEAYNGLNAQDAPANLVPVGTGPYRVVEFNKEDVLIIGEDTVNTVKIIYEPNPFFRESDKPYFSRVELQGGGGDAVMAARAVKDGLADFGWNVVVSEEVLAELEAGGQVKLISTPGAFVERIMLNFTDPNRQTADGERSSIQFPHPFLTDKRVRQALAYAIDREAIARLYGRTGRVTSNVLVSPVIYNSPNTTYEFNLEKAAALLDKAGWVDSDGDGIREKDGVKLSLVYQTSINPVRQQTQEIVKEALEKLGVEVELKNIDSSVFFGPGTDNTNTRRHFYADLEEFSFSNKNPDPNDYMKGWTCDEIAQKTNDWSLSNWARYCNPAYDALYQQLATELDPAKRQQLFIQMNDLLIEDIALIPLVHQADIFAISNTVEGYNPTPWDAEVWNIKDWRRK